MGHFTIYAQLHPKPEETGIILFEDFYTDGGDTIWLEYSDTADVPEMARMDPAHSLGIGVTLSGITSPVNSGLYGIHVAGMFKKKNMPEGTFGEDQWQLMEYLCPTVLRFPGGAESKLMHVLHTIDPSDPPETRSKGYGYDIDEIIRYFDYTDGVMNVSGNPLTDPVESLDWINLDHRESYNKYRLFYLEQSTLAEDDHYIDQFIRLIKQIEDAHPGHTVKVVLNLNIISESPQECRQIVEYLQNNEIHNIEVYGVEMGNECYSEFFVQSMGFNAFEKYWEYINGEPVTGFDLSPVLEGAIELDHDFISAFKSDVDFEMKVGVVGYDDPDVSGEHALRLTETEDGMVLSSDWNLQLRSHYSDLVPVSGTPFSRFAFDAVILHPYYGTHNYKEELEEYLETEYVCDDPELGGNWEYVFPDPRLADAFEFFKTKMKSFIKTEYKQAYLAWHADLEFDLPVVSGGKELWTTEWNFKDKDGATADPKEKNRLAAYSNSFMQGCFDLEWYLKNAKMNFDNDYRNNFFTIATMHNWGGGGLGEMLSQADTRELIYLGLNEFPYDEPSDSPDRRNYYLPRNNYIVYDLLHTIAYDGLEYMKTNFSMNILNPNVQPTIFIDAGRSTLYMYFTNVREVKQEYIVDYNSLLSWFAGADGIEIGSSTIHAVDARQLYSTAGKSSLYPLNTCYNTTTNMYELEYAEASPTPVVFDCDPGLPFKKCFSVEAYSYGYIEVPFAPHYMEKGSDPEKYYTDSLQIIPNPATDYITFRTSSSTCYAVRFEVVGTDGRIWISAESDICSETDVSQLAAGAYLVRVHTVSGAMLLSQIFIKQ